MPASDQEAEVASLKCGVEKVSHPTSHLSELGPLPGDGLRVFEASQPHLRTMLKRETVRPQDYDDLIQEAYLGFSAFLQKPKAEIDTSVTLLPVLLDIMQKRISDYSTRKRWKPQSTGGTDAQEMMEAVIESRERDSVVEAKSAWERHPGLEDQTMRNLREQMDTDAFYILTRRRTELPATLQALANELKLSIGKVHRLETLGKEMFQVEFEKLLKSAINKPR